MYQPNRHLSKMHLMNYMIVFYTGNKRLAKNLAQYGASALSPFNPPLNAVDNSHNTTQHTAKSMTD